MGILFCKAKRLLLMMQEQLVFSCFLSDEWLAGEYQT